MPGVLDGVSTRGEYADLSTLYLIAGCAVFVLVATLVVVIAFRGARRSRSPSGRTEWPRVEGSLAALLAITAAALVVVTFRTDARTTDAGGGQSAVRVNVVAAKWHWRFRYPDLGIAEQGTDEHVPTLVVPRDRRVEFRGRSIDVIHGFWIPSEKFQRELFNDRVSRWSMSFQKGDAGGNSGECSFFCGLRHAQMRFRVRVLDPADFERWARERRSRAAA
jgi:cytochrome c oxidase subunit II